MFYLNTTPLLLPPLKKTTRTKQQYPEQKYKMIKQNKQEQIKHNNYNIKHYIKKTIFNLSFLNLYKQIKNLDCLGVNNVNGSFQCDPTVCPS